VALARRFGTHSLICRSQEMLRVAGQVAIARATPTTVLIWGEKGSGKKDVVESLRAQTPEQPGLRLIVSTTFAPPVFEADERLRPDFFHLITHLCIAVPPLRRRQEDLRFLAQHLLEESNRGESRQFNGFGDDVWGRFGEYNWPGNVDELLAVIREARAACNE